MQMGLLDDLVGMLACYSLRCSTFNETVHQLGNKSATADKIFRTTETRNSPSHAEWQIFLPPVHYLHMFAYRGLSCTSGGFRHRNYKLLHRPSIHAQICLYRHKFKRRSHHLSIHRLCDVPNRLNSCIRWWDQPLASRQWNGLEPPPFLQPRGRDFKVVKASPLFLL